MRGCSISSTLMATTKQCTVRNSSMECVFQDATRLSFPSSNQTNCLFLLNPSGRLDGHVEASISYVGLTCKPDASYFTRHYKASISSARRCKYAGECTTSNICGAVEYNRKIADLGAANHHLGFTRCADAEGGWFHSCWSFDPSCLFYRTHMLAVEDKIGRVYNCSKWEPKIVLSVEVCKGLQRNH